MYNPGKVAKQSDSLKFSTTDPAVSFQFISDHTRQSYTLKTDGGLYVDRRSGVLLYYAACGDAGAQNRELKMEDGE